MRPQLLIGLIAALCAPPAAAQVSACQPCHPKIARTWASAGMGRSFSRLTPETASEDFRRGNPYYHAASDRYYTMLERGGRYFQRRHQLDAAGRQINIVEKEIHYVMGSGNHARTYLHRTARGTLVQLPLGWYSEDGGKWAMSPGYDHPRHDDFRREIAYKCMACHNAYPAVAADGTREEPPVYPAALPEGIDCQRCHGPGDEHIRQARRGAKPDALRAAIVNPRRLGRDRALDVCMQCHLQSSVGELPHSVLLPGRGPFSFRPGEAMATHAIHFEPADGSARKKFEIDSAGYRLLHSACFRHSDMTCTTCHDPHHIERGAQAADRYTRACLKCHEARLSALASTQRHLKARECQSCHMPKRRSEDVVHVVMTDHAIPRRPPDGDPLAPLRERLGPRYRGEVQPYYPATLPDTAEVRLTIALAQVTDDSNTAAGALRLREAIERMNSPPVKALVELARAYGRLSQHSEAARWFAAAIERRPADSGPRVAFGRWLLASGDAHAAVEQLRSARHIEPASPRIAADLGTALVMAKNPAEAAIVLQDAVRRHPDLAVAHNGLGLAYQGTGRVAQAISAFREAIRVQPDYSEAWVNLGIALAGSGHRPEARAAFERALHHDPRSAGAHHNYGLLLMESGDRNRAEEHFRTAFELDPSSDASRVSLAFLLLAKDRHAEAVALLETVIQRTPDFAQARLYLGVALAAQGKTAAARAHLHRAASSEDPAVRRAAEQHLRQTR